MDNVRHHDRVEISPTSLAFGSKVVLSHFLQELSLTREEVIHSLDIREAGVGLQTSADPAC